jgi:uncharacterized protein involved in response to NO
MTLERRLDLWRREPYRLMFPLAGALLFAGLGHWLLLAVGAFGEYRSIFHAMTLVQAVMACFAVGFLFTFIPRRTMSAPPSALELFLVVVGPVLTASLAWFEAYAWSQLGWALLLITVLQFAVRRFRTARTKRRLPGSMIWVPVSVGASLVGTVLAGVGGALGGSAFWLHNLGQDLVLQGLFSGLVLGIGSVLLPVLTRAEPFADGACVHERWAHLFAAVLFFGSYVLEHRGYSAPANGLRAFIALAIWLGAAQLHRLPNQPGLHRRLVWLSAWLLPLGYTLVAAFPHHRRAALHVIFIGCFALMALAVSTHVMLAHTGNSQRLNGRPWQTVAFGALAVVALAFRALVELDPLRLMLWLGLASGTFLLAASAWASLVLPTLWAKVPPHPTP